MNLAQIRFDLTKEEWREATTVPPDALREWATSRLAGSPDLQDTLNIEGSFLSLSYFTEQVVWGYNGTR